MKLLNEYFDTQKKIFDYFGYKEDWVTIPLKDLTDYYWTLCQDSDGHGCVKSGGTKEDLLKQDGDYYEDEIYTQRFLPKWVYRGEEYTMICIDTHCDGNKYLSVFDNSKEIKERQ
jgi:hypothetical protein